MPTKTPNLNNLNKVDNILNEAKNIISSTD